MPDELHRRLKARAALAGLSLSDYLLGELKRAADRPTMEEMLERLRSRAQVEVGEDVVDAVRAERDAR